MYKLKTQYLFLVIIFCVFTCIAYAADNEKTTLQQFLSSESKIERLKAFNIIINNDIKYKNLVLIELHKYEADPTKTPDALLYLATFFKDTRYVHTLSKLITNEAYSDESCIYDCPIVFSLTILSTFADCPLPKLDKRVMAVQDLIDEIKRVKNISMKPEKASKYIQGPGIDKYLKEMEILPIPYIIKIAGQDTAPYEKRMAAVYTLSYNIINDQYINELYWLAITELEDASREYRCAIYSAIYRAETFRKRKGK